MEKNIQKKIQLYLEYKDICGYSNWSFTPHKIPEDVQQVDVDKLIVMRRDAAATKRRALDGLFARIRHHKKCFETIDLPHLGVFNYIYKVIDTCRTAIEIYQFNINVKNKLSPISSNHIQKKSVSRLPLIKYSPPNTQILNHQIDKSISLQTVLPVPIYPSTVKSKEIKSLSQPPKNKPNKSHKSNKSKNKSNKSKKSKMSRKEEEEFLKQAQELVLIETQIELKRKLKIIFKIKKTH